MGAASQQNTKRLQNLTNAGKGRRKGVPNKSTRLAKDAIAAAAEALGGADRLTAWCKEHEKNERIFWGTIYPRLLPLQIAGDPDSPVRVITEIKLVGVMPK